MNAALIHLWRSDSFRRVARTFVIAFLTVLVPGLLGWLNALTEWAKGDGQTPLPDGHSLAYVGISAIAAGLIALVNLVWNWVEDATGKGLLRTPASPVADTAMGETIEDEPDEVPMPPTVPALDKADAEKMLKRDLVAYVSGEAPPAVD